MDKEMQNNTENMEVLEIENSGIAESIINSMIEEYGIGAVVIGGLIGIGSAISSGAISMAIYFSKCKKNNLGGMKNVKR